MFAHSPSFPSLLTREWTNNSVSSRDLKRLSPIPPHHQGLIDDHLKNRHDCIVYVFTDDPDYKYVYQKKWRYFLKEGRLKFGPTDYDMQVKGKCSHSAGDACKFKRITDMRETLLDFAIMSRCDHIYWTAGSTVTYLVRAMRARWNSEPFSIDVTIGDWNVPSTPTYNFREQLKAFLNTAHKFMMDTSETMITHDQWQCLLFLMDHHLDEIHGLIKQKIETSGRTSVGGAQVGEYLIRWSPVAQKNRKKFQSSARAAGGQHWLKALIRSVLKHWTLKHDEVEQVVLMEEDGQVSLRNKENWEYSSYYSWSQSSSSTSTWTSAKKRKTDQ